MLDKCVKIIKVNVLNFEMKILCKQGESITIKKININWSAIVSERDRSKTPCE